MGCLTLECYVNNLAKGRGHAGMGGPLRKGKAGGAMDTIGAKKNPAGVNLRGLTIGLG